MEAIEASNLSRRERQIMDVIFRLGEASAADVQKELPNAPSYSAVRALLAILVDKGCLKHEKFQRRYIYRPTVNPDRAKRSAVKNLLSTFYNDSAERLVASLLDPKDLKLSPQEIDRIRKLIDDCEEREVEQ
ncbi:MAG: BlaI/MecI/CopY family transcriptional regulator [Verrucomicrobiae bacterium]|nr:BlaI/MecI/CopY family transcriptional regulator [Verrucomicrobiae bacterium]